MSHPRGETQWVSPHGRGRTYNQPTTCDTPLRRNPLDNASPEKEKNEVRRNHVQNASSLSRQFAIPHSSPPSFVISLSSQLQASRRGRPGPLNKHYRLYRLCRRPGPFVPGLPAALVRLTPVGPVLLLAGPSKRRILNLRIVRLRAAIPIYPAMSAVGVYRPRTGPRMRFTSCIAGCCLVIAVAPTCVR